MNTLLSFVSTIEAIAMSIPGVAYFVHGDSDEITALETNASIRYPCVWLETPASTLGDEHEEQWAARLLVLAKATPKTTALVTQRRSETHTLARKLVARLRHEEELANTWSIATSKVRLQPIYVGSDGNAGWYFDLPISVDSECFTNEDLGINE